LATSDQQYNDEYRHPYAYAIRFSGEHRLTFLTQYGMFAVMANG